MSESVEMVRQAEQLKLDSARTQLERNINGQFATPNSLALAIVRDALARVPNASSCIEPACGTGSFVSAVCQEKCSLEIVAIEKDPDYCEVARRLFGGDSCEIIQADFFDIAQSLGQFSLLVSNPPYTRHHHLCAEDKEAYSSITRMMSGVKMSQLAGLHAYFIAAGTSLLEAGGIASWLVPSELFSVNYGSAIREYVTSRVSVERIHFFDNNDLQFDDALISSCVLVLRNVPTTRETMVSITVGNFENPKKTAHVSAEELRAQKKWQHFFVESESDSKGSVRDLFKVSRGMSTGDDRFFVHPRSFWHEKGIEDKWLQPVLPPPRYLKCDLVSEDTDGWPIETDRAVLKIPKDIDFSALPEAIRDYLDTCPEKTRNGYTLTHRKKWYSVEDRKPAPIVCTYMSRSEEQPFRFIRNKSDAVVTTAYLCMYPLKPLTECELDGLAEALRAIPPSELIKSGREYGGGLRKLEPSELLSVHVGI